MRRERGFRRALGRVRRPRPARPRHRGARLLRRSLGLAVPALGDVHDCPARPDRGRAVPVHRQHHHINGGREMSMLRTKTPPASQVTEPDAPTVALPEPEPEVAAAQAALDGLPAEWVREDFAATILRRANLQAATRKLAARIAAAEVATAVALVAVEAGEDTDEAITSLVSLKAAQGRLEAARGVLPPATTDAAAVNTVLSVAALTLQ